MKWSWQKSVALLGTLAIAAAGGFGIGPLMRRGVSPETAGMVAGALGTLCLVAIGLGIRNVRRSEAKRKAREKIWLKH